MTDNQNPNIEHRYHILQDALRDTFGDQYMRPPQINYETIINKLEDRVKELENRIVELEKRIEWMENHK